MPDVGSDIIFMMSSCSVNRGSFVFWRHFCKTFRQIWRKFIDCL